LGGEDFSIKKHIGNIKIDPINPKHTLGEYGILIGHKDYWVKWYNKQVSNEIFDFCFK
jgi:ribosomal-protein-alanine N-acetyltransferase